MSQKTQWVWVTFQKVGFHRYPAAATDPTLANFQYLGDKHRHLFKFKVFIEVFHGDRDVEFHAALNFCESLFETRTIDIDYKSVEMLADDLYEKLHEKYPGRKMKIEVSEDGECGGLIEYN